MREHPKQQLLPPSVWPVAARLELNANADNCVIQLLFKAAAHPT